MKDKKTKIPDLPPPPEKPQMSECCQRGCEKCVFDYYEEAFRRWQDRISRILEENGIKFHASGHRE